MNGRRFCLVLVCSVLAPTLLAAGVALADATNLGQLPMKRAAANFKLRIAVESVGGNGYQPVHLRFRPNAKSFSRDRNFSVVLSPQRDHGSELSFSIDQSIIVSEGSLGEDLIVYIPHYYPWDNLRVQLLEDGREVETGRNTFAMNNRQKYMGQHVSVGLIVGKGTGDTWETCPDIRTLSTVLGDGPLPTDSETKRLKHPRAIAFASQTQPAWVQYRVITQQECYPNWLGYSQLDVIIVAAPVLQRIAVNQPDEFDAIRKWVAAGGNLWLYAAKNATDPLGGKLRPVTISDNDFVRQTNQPLAVPSMNRLDLGSFNDDSQITNDYWSGPRKASVNMSQSGFRQRRDVFKDLESEKHPFADRVTWKAIKGKLTQYSFGLGRVIMIADDDPFPGSFQFWDSVKIIAGGNLNWTERFGIDVPAGNDRYWSWLIPSVGKPPVKSFVVLNVLFATAVGPFCYFFFRRRQRLYLLYFAAPALALLVTSSLFAYAIGSDGLSTKMRSRQVTWLDSQNKLSVQQSRQTYYAVMGRSGGIVLPADAVVSPVQYSPMLNYYGSDRSKKSGVVSVDDSIQRLSSGFLPPREQVQYLITRPADTNEGISFHFSEVGSTVRNDSPHQLRRIFVCDQSGKFWEASDLKPGAETTLSASNRFACQLFLGAELPLNQASVYVPELQRNRNYYSGYKSAGTETNLLERRLQQWATAGMPKGTFAGQADLDTMQLGVQDATVLNSVHLIMGDMP